MNDLAKEIVDLLIAGEKIQAIELLRGATVVPELKFGRADRDFAAGLLVEPTGP